MIVNFVFIIFHLTNLEFIGIADLFLDIDFEAFGPIFCIFIRYFKKTLIMHRVLDTFSKFVVYRNPTIYYCL